jgi:ribokinase
MIQGAGMHILNFGSINIDIAFSVDHIVTPGETLASKHLSRSTGGKGANQSVAVARAGGHEVFHVGKIGEDGRWIIDKLASYQVNTDYISVGNTPTGQALIQVAEDGENAIVLYGGSNHTFSESEIDAVLENFPSDTIVMLQNEINHIDYIIQAAHKRNMTICFNPAPFDPSVLHLPLSYVTMFFLNEVESEGISHITDPNQAIEYLTQQYPDAEIILTRGSEGVLYGKGPTIRHKLGTWKVPVVDTTGAGDTFIGCYIARRAQGDSIQSALETATKAAAIAVMHPGAMESIPHAHALSEIGLFAESSG